MDESPLFLGNPKKHLIDRLLALFEVLLMSGLLSSSLAALAFPKKRLAILANDPQTLSAFLLLEAFISISLLVIIMRVHGESPSSLGLRRARWKPNLILGLSLVPLLFLINGIVVLAFRYYLPRYYIERNPLTETIQTPHQLALFLISAIIAGGIKEELQRAFILNRFDCYLGGAGVGLVIWSLGFGAGHYLQGWQGVVITTVCGMIFGLTYILTRSLIGPIVAHGTYDILALLLYWHSLGQFR